MTTAEGRAPVAGEVGQDARTLAPAPSPEPPSADPLLDEIAHLRAALATRTIIGQATGIVGGRLDVGTETAWQILRRASVDTNHKLRRVSEVIVSSHDGKRPASDDAIAQDIAPILGFSLDDRRSGADGGRAVTSRAATSASSSRSPTPARPPTR
jgi:hypothetical protein